MTTGMERLRFMLGEWTIEAHVMNEIEEWETISLPTETTILPMLGGACHHEIMPVCFDGTITHFFFSWSYDPYRHIYRMISCTDSDGLMGVMEGDFIDTNTVVISDVNTGTAILNSDGQPAFLGNSPLLKTTPIVLLILCPNLMMVGTVGCRFFGLYIRASSNLFK